MKTKALVLTAALVLSRTVIASTDILLVAEYHAVYEPQLKSCAVCRQRLDRNAAWTVNLSTSRVVYIHARCMGSVSTGLVLTASTSSP